MSFSIYPVWVLLSPHDKVPAVGVRELRLQDIPGDAKVFAVAKGIQVVLFFQHIAHAGGGRCPGYNVFDGHGHAAIIRHIYGIGVAFGVGGLKHGPLGAAGRDHFDIGHIGLFRAITFHDVHDARADGIQSVGRLCNSRCGILSLAPYIILAADVVGGAHFPAGWVINQAGRVSIDRSQYSAALIVVGIPAVYIAVIVLVSVALDGAACGIKHLLITARVHGATVKGLVALRLAVVVVQHFAKKLRNGDPFILVRGHGAVVEVRQLALTVDFLIEIKVHVVAHDAPLPERFAVLLHFHDGFQLLQSRMSDIAQRHGSLKAARFAVFPGEHRIQQDFGVILGTRVIDADLFAPCIDCRLSPGIDFIAHKLFTFVGVV